jgi:hypothetical protein
MTTEQTQNSTEDPQTSCPYAVEFYSMKINAWVNTSMELDKSLLTLSTAGIGLLLTLMTTVGARSVEGGLLSCLAMLSFVVCLIAVLFVFNGNKKRIEEIIQNQEQAPKQTYLSILDRIAFVSFALGVVFSLVLGISAVINNFSNKDIRMSDIKDKQVEQPKLVDLTGSLSLDKINTLGPEPVPQPPKEKKTDSDKK